MSVSALRRGRAGWFWLAVLVAGVSALASLVVPLEARASSAWRVVRYRGVPLMVPATWPVFRLDAHPFVCVRFNRHALYLGRPGAEQLCPSQVMGRTEAILVQPIVAGRSSLRGATRTLPAPSLAAADAPQGTEAQLVDRSRGVLVTATWNRRPEVIAQALGIRSVEPLAVASRVPPAAAPQRVLAHRNTVAQMASAAGAGQVYTGQAFDACTAPSSSQMAAWSSAYRGIGVYIGGVNMGCSQANLTSSWVVQESSAGWHLIPIYVGLQAPGNSCGCAPISPGSAASEGNAAARDAVSQAQAIGLGPGNPIYYDMEGYARGGTTSSAVLTFLSAWTQQLHAEGYKSGIYSSDDSGIVDLVSKYGSGYSEPDDIWAAAWNGQANTNDSNIPSSDWADHQRLHQYAGNLTQTHGGVTINIDSDYVDGATAAAGSSTATRPVNTAPPSISGTPFQGQTLTQNHGSWSGNPNSYSYAWEDCSSSGNSCAQISGANGDTYTLRSSDLGHTIRVVETAANSAGSGSPATSSPTGVVQRQPTYWVYTAWGNVYGSYGAVFYGSPWASETGDSQITGMAPTPGGGGYWMTDSFGHVYPYGNAHSLVQYVSPDHPAISGIVASPSGGYWLYTASGNVYTSANATWYGSPWASHTGDDHITGMAPTPDGKGYWMVDSSGHVYHYGDAQNLVNYISPDHPWISGIAASPSGGYWLYTASGTVYTSAHATWYGSPWASHTGDDHISGLAATPDGDGYWMVDSSGHVYHYGDAPSLATGLSPNPPPVTGIVP